MKTELLDINGKTELHVAGITAKNYDLSYDFEKAAIVSKKHNTSKRISTYIISKELANAVNAAIVTNRPLLIKGEPGCGKTRLAQAVASYFYGQETYKYYFEWHVKSKSKARDGGYLFDHVGRLRDATISSSDEIAKAKAAEASNYVTMGAMGYAFQAIAPEGKKPILLIDEIDKGDIDFPNDLLLELDEMRFKINEMKETYIDAPTDQRPLVFITSNDERELPPAFLRRCLYYYIPRFKKPLLTKIATSKLQEFYEELIIENPKPLPDESMDKFISEFQRVKENASGKPPSTSELLDWLKLLTFKQYNENISFNDLITDPALQNIALKLNA